MAFSQEFDPAKGYVALPCDVMDIEMSPGAFRLLTELCRMANRAGECWPSLGQLSERIGRSKAAISGYIAELREIELLETTRQQMANGYNYRLKYCVTFWRDWRAQLSAPRPARPAQKPECSVQPIERRVNSKNQSHKKQTPQDDDQSESVSPQLVSVFSKWSDLAKSAPFPKFNAPVEDTLLDQTRALVQGASPDTLDEAAIRQRLRQLWKRHNVTLNASDITLQTRELRDKKTSAAGLQCFEAEVDKTWQAHWRKAPNAHQFADLLARAQSSNRQEGMLRVLKQYLRRWEISQNKLQRPPVSPNLALNRAA